LTKRKINSRCCSRRNGNFFLKKCVVESRWNWLWFVKIIKIFVQCQKKLGNNSCRHIPFNTSWYYKQLSFVCEYVMLHLKLLGSRWSSMCGNVFAEQNGPLTRLTMHIKVSNIIQAILCIELVEFSK